jgi:hypothetical protein
MQVNISKIHLKDNKRVSFFIPVTFVLGCEEKDDPLNIKFDIELAPAFHYVTEYDNKGNPIQIDIGGGEFMESEVCVKYEHNHKGLISGTLTIDPKDGTISASNFDNNVVDVVGFDLNASS